MKEFEYKFTGCCVVDDSIYAIQKNCNKLLKINKQNLFVEKIIEFTE